MKNSMKKKNSKKTKEIIFALAILAVPLLWWAFSFTYQTGGTILLAFKKYNPLTQETVWCGLDNFKQVFSEIGTSGTLLNVSLKNSVILWLVQVFISIPLSVIISFGLYKNVYGAKIYKIILFLPHIISGMVWVLIYKTFIEYGLRADYIINENKNFMALYLYSFWLGFAGNMIMYTGAMSRIPISLVEAGHLDGMTDMQEFWYIALPLVYPTMSIVLITCVVSIFTVQLPVHQFYDTANSVKPEKYHLYTFGFYNFIKGLGGDLTETPIISALSMIVCVIAAPVSLGVKSLLNKIGPTVEY